MVFLAACVGAAEPQKTQLVGKYLWFDTQRSFGGFSGLEVSPDGNSFHAITDQGLSIDGTFQREDGVITAVQTGRLDELIGPDGIAIWRNEVRDAEGLATLPNGQFAVSFEGIHKVLLFTDTEHSIELPQHPDFPGLSDNASLEAAAADFTGAIYVIPEKSGQVTRPFNVYRYKNGAWDVPFAVPRRNGFLVVGLDFGPDGLLYVLERAFAGYGFQSRIRRFSVTQNGLEAEEILMQSHVFEFDNLEGLSVWRDAQGQIRLTALSDDNFNFFQQTQFVEFVVNE